MSLTLLSGDIFGFKQNEGNGQSNERGKRVMYAGYQNIQNVKRRD
jgi:hypothetical protein